MGTKSNGGRNDPKTKQNGKGSDRIRRTCVTIINQAIGMNRSAKSDLHHVVKSGSTVGTGHRSVKNSSPPAETRGTGSVWEVEGSREAKRKSSRNEGGCDRVGLGLFFFPLKSTRSKTKETVNTGSSQDRREGRRRSQMSNSGDGTGDASVRRQVLLRQGLTGLEIMIFITLFL